MKVLVKKPNFVTPPGEIFDPSVVYNETNYENLIHCIDTGILEIVEGSLDDLKFIPKKQELKIEYSKVEQKK